MLCIFFFWTDRWFNHFALLSWWQVRVLGWSHWSDNDSTCHHCHPSNAHCYGDNIIFHALWILGHHLDIFEKEGGMQSRKVISCHKCIVNIQYHSVFSCGQVVPQWIFHKHFMHVNRILPWCCIVHLWNIFTKQAYCKSLFLYCRDIPNNVITGKEVYLHVCIARCKIYLVPEVQFRKNVACIALTSF